MSFSLETYIQYALGRGEWQDYQRDLYSSNSLFIINTKDIPENLRSIREDDWEKTQKLYKHKRVIFKSSPVPLSVDLNGYFVGINGNIDRITVQSPYIQSYKATCTYCNRTWFVTCPFPSAIVDHRDDACSDLHCVSFNSKKGKNTYEYVYVDCCEMIVRHANITVRCYITNIPKVGFMEIKAKMMAAYETGSPVILYGIPKVIRTDRLEYAMIVYDLDLLNPHDISYKMIPFLNFALPTSEKEMVMSIFFANLDFMRSYLGFVTYELRERYPDLILQCTNGKIMNVEFEFDVGGFYKHGHHTQQPQCHYIIAWQNTSSHNEYPYILLPDLVGKIIAEKQLSQPPADILHGLNQFLIAQFPHKSANDISSLLFALITSIRPMPSLFGVKKIVLIPDSFSDSDWEKWEDLKKMFQVPKNALCVVDQYESGKRVHVTLTNSDRIAEVNPQFMGKYDQIKQYIFETLTYNSRLPSMLVDPSCYSMLYQQQPDYQYVDLWIMLGSIVASFLRSPQVTIQDIQIAQEIRGMAIISTESIT